MGGFIKTNKKRSIDPTISEIHAFRKLCHTEITKTWYHDIIVVEELAELITALSHHQRGWTNRSNVIEEIVDVKIILRYLELKFELKQEECDRLIKLKIDKLRGRLESAV